MEQPQYRAWLEDSWRPVLESRAITKGKKKGWIEVKYRSSATLIRKNIIKPEALKEITGYGSEKTSNRKHDGATGGEPIEAPGKDCGKQLGPVSGASSKGRKGAQLEKVFGRGKTGKKRKPRRTRKSIN